MVNTGAVVSILTTGGTIASRGFAGGARPDVRGDDLVATIAPTDLVLRVREILHVDSSAILPADQDAIRLAVDAEFADPDVCGVVVTHGTDTMEETAMLLDLMHDDPRPLIMTGAQRPADSPDADGPTNLSAAIAAAADDRSRGSGVLIAMGGSLTPARGATKLDSGALAPFAEIHPGLARPVLPRTCIARARVDLLSLYPGVDPELLDWSVSRGADGMVLSATGSGNTHPEVVAAVTRAIDRGVVVVLCSRVPRGHVIAHYGGGGGAVDLVHEGAIISPWLRASQSRIALQVILAGGGGRPEADAFFGTA
ncbi:L-asparaginase [Williamsia limnetica]|uniref:asparaginase n=1 Tax=Williamsia limnetica TaxID=882452 RepID=A0A318RK44_WILLI|nr:asparaginase [Williamsia limnetica]PYE15813.1 L-asparaginase [Williamsia limnetica]